jgi:hypothetical protein
MLTHSVAAPAQTRQMSRAEYEACQTRDEASFRTAIEAVTLRSLQEGLKKVDYAGLVNDEWRKSSFDDILDKRVDMTVAEVASETSLWERSRTLFDKEKAKELAVSVAERVYRSDTVKTGLEGLITGVARQAGGSILLATSDAAEPAVECLKSFLGPRYGATVARVVSADAQREFQLDPAKVSQGISPGSVLGEAGSGLAGAVILAVRRQLANIATRVSQRVVGSILGRLVSVVAGGIGLVLIAKDIWEFRNGVLPIVATEMKSRATKDLVKAELAKAISEQISEHTREIAATTADRVVELWREFRRGHAKVVELVERNAEFRALVDTLKPTDLARLDEVVALLLATEGESAIAKRLTDGSLLTAVTRMPPGGMEIARETKSLEQGMQWSAKAGASLQQVIELGLHRRASAADFSAAQLKRLLALDDRTATTRLASIPRVARDTIMELPDREVRSLAKAISETELEALAGYLTGLEKPARERVLQAVAGSPSRMQLLAPTRVREAVLASKDQLAAVSMMLRPDPGLDIGVIRENVQLVYDGRISPVLLWDKHPGAIVGAGIGLLMLLLIFQRLLFGRRGRARKVAA